MPQRFYSLLQYYIIIYRITPFHQKLVHIIAHNS